MIGVMQSASRRLGAIALLAMLVRALVPDGYMLASAGSPDGRFMVVQLCDGHASPSLVVDLETGDVSDLDEKQNIPVKQSSGQTCAFAASGPMTAPNSTAEPVKFAQQDQKVAFTTPTLRPGRGIPAPPPPSTGPPQNV